MQLSITTTNVAFIPSSLMDGQSMVLDFSLILAFVFTLIANEESQSSMSPGPTQGQEAVDQKHAAVGVFGG